MTYNSYQLQKNNLLNKPGLDTGKQGNTQMQTLIKTIEKTFETSGIQGKTLQASAGPVVTTIEYKPDTGTKLKHIAALSDKLALALKVKNIRMAIPIPGKNAIGIEIPNKVRTQVCFQQTQTTGKTSEPVTLPDICMGLDTAGNRISWPLDEVAPLFIAGENATEKQMGLNVFISNILLQAAPETVKLLIIDPENSLDIFKEVPHLEKPVIDDLPQAVEALSQATEEMERRQELFRNACVKDITQFNNSAGRPEKLAHLVIVVSELAGLMDQASMETEQCVARIAQTAPAHGIHLVLATQTPSVTVLPGLFKALFQTRICFKMSSREYSWTVLDGTDALTLSGDGDMLVWSAKSSSLTRIHGASIFDDELTELIEFRQQQN